MDRRLVLLCGHVVLLTPTGTLLRSRLASAKSMRRRCGRNFNRGVGSMSRAGVRVEGVWTRATAGSPGADGPGAVWLGGSVVPRHRMGAMRGCGRTTAHAARPRRVGRGERCALRRSATGNLALVPLTEACSQLHSRDAWRPRPAGEKGANAPLDPVTSPSPDCPVKECHSTPQDVCNYNRR